MRSLLLALLATVVVALSADSAFAAPKAATAKAHARIVAQDLARFRRTFARLSPLDQERVLAYLRDNSSYLDSDSDGLPDIAESAEGSGVCDSDSDDDGTPDGEESESSGRVSAYDSEAGTFVVASVSFKLDESTEFEEMSLEDLQVGVCVEVEGKLEEGLRIATKVSAESCH